jgi:hypothetical protein
MLLISELLKASSSWNHQRIALCWSRKFLVVQAAQEWAIFPAVKKSRKIQTE